MKYYDARMIEGCCVFSYAVECPSAKDTKHRKNNERKMKNASFKKALLRFFFLLLAPFSFAVNATAKGFRTLAKTFRSCALICSRAREITACVLVAISSTALIPLIFLFL